MTTLPLLPTTVVGSHGKPGWWYAAVKDVGGPAVLALMPLTLSLSDDPRPARSLPGEGPPPLDNLLMPNAWASQTASAVWPFSLVKNPSR